MASSFGHARIVVIGAGLTGLTFAKTLQRSGVAASVQVVDRFSSRPRRGIGLWPRASSILQELGVDMGAISRSVPPAAYRNIGGRWLSSASPTTSSKIRVSTFVENDAIDQLRRGLRVSTREVKRLEDNRLIFTDGGFIEADLVVLAGGMGSPDKLGVDSEERNGSSRRMVKTVSGICSASTIGSLPFEVFLRPQCRFMSVPLPGESAFWFFTRPGSPTEEETDVQIEIDDIVDHIGGNFRELEELVKSSDDDTILTRWVPLEHPEMPFAHTHLDGRLLRLGDAFCTIPNNLAQGGSIGIENAYHFATLLGASRDAYSCRRQLDRVEEAARQRLASCVQVSKFTAALSLFPRVSSAMAYVPRFINGRIFDAFLMASLTSGAERLRATR